MQIKLKNILVFVCLLFAFLFFPKVFVQGANVKSVAVSQRSVPQMRNNPPSSSHYQNMRCYCVKRGTRTICYMVADRPGRI